MPGRLIWAMAAVWMARLRLAVASSVEPVSDNSSAAGLDGGGAVGHGEAVLGREAGWVADLGEDLCCGQRSDAVDAGEAGVGVVEQQGDALCHSVDLAAEAAYVADAAAADLGACAVVTAQQLARRVEPGTAGERPGAVVVSRSGSSLGCCGGG